MAFSPKAPRMPFYLCNATYYPPRAICVEDDSYSVSHCLCNIPKFHFPGFYEANNLNTFYKNLSMWLVIGLTMILLFQLFNKPQHQSNSITYSEFWSSVEKGAINKVSIQGEQISGVGQDGRPFKTVAPSDAGLIPMLRDSNVDISVKKPEETPWYLTIFISWFPMLLLIGVWIFFMRQMQMGAKVGL